MTIAFERQELRALALRPIRHLPSYSTDYTSASRVGIVLANHKAGVDPSCRWDLERTLSAAALRGIVGPK